MRYDTSKDQITACIDRYSQWLAPQKQIAADKEQGYRVFVAADELQRTLLQHQVDTSRDKQDKLYCQTPKERPSNRFHWPEQCQPDWPTMQLALHPSIDCIATYRMLSYASLMLSAVCCPVVLPQHSPVWMALKFHRHDPDRMGSRVA